MTSWIALAAAVAAKDLRVEFRTRERIVVMGAFIVLAGVLFNYAIDRTAVHPREIAAGLVWVTIVLSGLLGLGRTFELEKEDGAMDALLAAPLPRDALFVGKVMANTLLLWGVAFFTLAVFWLFFQLQMPGNPLPLFGVLLLGTTGFAAMGTLFGGITAGTRMQESLLPVLLFPLVVPLITFGVRATADLLAGFPPEHSAPSLRVLGAFTLIALTAGVGLFRFIVED